MQKNVVEKYTNVMIDASILLNSICSHSIASAEVNGDLVDFLDWYSKGQSYYSVFSRHQSNFEYPSCGITNNDGLPINVTSTSSELGTYAIFPSPTTVFYLVILHGNISVCYGCCRKFPKKEDKGFADPPYNLTIQHEEDRCFTNNQKSLFGNPREACILPCMYAMCTC